MSFSFIQSQGGDYLKMVFKVEIRQNPEYSFLTYEEIHEITKKLIESC